MLLALEQVLGSNVCGNNDDLLFVSHLARRYATRNATILQSAVTRVRVRVRVRCDERAEAAAAVVAKRATAGCLQFLAAVLHARCACECHPAQKYLEAEFGVWVLVEDGLG